MPLGFLKEVSIIHKSYHGTTNYVLDSIVRLKIYLFNHVVLEVNSRPVTLSVNSVIFKRIKNVPLLWNPGGSRKGLIKEGLPVLPSVYPDIFLESD